MKSEIPADNQRFNGSRDANEFSPVLASVDDIDGILSLVERNPGNLLARTREDMLELLATTWVAHDKALLSEHSGSKNKVIGCVCLEIYSPKICELRTLAVDPQFQRFGIGTKLVSIAVAEAKARNIPQILTVTSSPEWFEKQNFGSCLKEKFALFYRG